MVLFVTQFLNPVKLINSVKSLLVVGIARISNMKIHITETSIAVRGTEGTRRTVNTFPSLLTLSNGEVLLVCRAGSTKDSDDEIIEIRRSTDAGRSWGEPIAPFPDDLDGVRGSQKLAYLTELPGGALLAATMWVNRAAHPGKPLFNAKTEGCLPMAIMIFESTDGGRSWGAGRPVPMPASVGPPSLTAPLLRLSDGRLAMSIESNKRYDDPLPWRQFVSYFHSADNGRHWTGRPWFRKTRPGASSTGTSVPAWRRTVGSPASLGPMIRPPKNM